MEIILQMEIKARDKGDNIDERERERERESLPYNLAISPGLIRSNYSIKVPLLRESSI